MQCRRCGCKCIRTCECNCECKKKIWPPDEIHLTLSPFDYNMDEPVVVKFYTSNARVFTRTFPVRRIAKQIRSELEGIFGIPAEHLVISYQDVVLEDEAMLKSLVKDEEFKTLELKLATTDPCKYVIDIQKAYPDAIIVPDIITVQFNDGDYDKEFVVEIENKAVQKPMLGGYKHIKTGVKYFHGYSQTGPPPPKVPPDQQLTRDTQTFILRNRLLGMAYSQATQMATRELYIPCVTDKILTPGPYETADEREKRLDVKGKVRTIQRYYRAWKMRVALKELSQEYQKRMRLAQELEEQAQKEDDNRRRKDMVSKIFPVTLADFAMLFTMVDRWKKSEIARINSMYCGASKLAELYLLLEKEVEMLRGIENLRTKAAKDMEYKYIERFFRNIGKPIDWYSTYKSLHIFMETLECQRGRKYFTLYKNLVDKNLKVQEKLDVYAEIKEYINDHDCQDSDLLNTLINRACQLMVRGIEDKFLRGLEKRIEACVIHHFKMVECNEDVTKHMLMIQERKMEEKLTFCTRCRKFKTIDGYRLTARTETLRFCNKCKWLDKVEEPWIDLLPHRFILKQLRNYERLHRAASSVAFILQDVDIHHIVVRIWHGHSALSECNDIYQLRLVRWIREENWSPWNCILLTVDEMKAHLRVAKLEDVYEVEFVNHVFNKHALAKMHFHQLKSLDKRFTKLVKGDIKMDENSEYYKVPSMECLKDKSEDEEYDSEDDEDGGPCIHPGCVIDDSDHVHDDTNERGGDHRSERGGDHRSERGGDHVSERGGDHRNERGGDHGSDRGGDGGAAITDSKVNV
ncbi:unnamed protein product [Psylliodes chrysocephalus]|uniref:IQ motif and ubiquitin-like domain-containing protein n=1 Tax=Psylliodes chrysocephalus TaxID=3402493 RepID=A0A9P0D7D2_9CUCU|nr:unnamed protein product [Psylliodes chrysocephala]